MDSHYLYLINQAWTTPGLDWLMAILSSFDMFRPLFILAVLLTVIFGKFRARSTVICLILIVGTIDGVFSHALKKMVVRPRPGDVRNDIRMVELARAKPRLLALGKPLRIRRSHPTDELGGGNSFPSGHTANMFAAATILTAFYRWKGAIAFLGAASIGYSRIYTGSHWPSDILVSALMGIGEAALLLWLLDVCWRRWGTRWHAAHPTLLP